MPSALEGVKDGTKMRVQSLLSALESEFDVHAEAYKPGATTPTAGSLSPLGRLFSITPSLIKRFRSVEFARTVQDLSKDFDFCIAIGLQMAQYFESLPPSMPSLLDNYNVESDILWSLAQQRPWKTRWYWYLEALKLRLYESRAVLGADHCTAICKQDAARFTQLSPLARVDVLPPGLDLEIYGQAVSEPVPGRLTFIGALDWHVNEDAALWMAEEVLPRVQQAHPGAHLQIVGRSPSARLRALSSRAGVTIHPNVPSVLPYLSQAQVVVAPLRYGSGVQTKVIEAMAAGKAVVVSPVSATGIDATPDQHFYLGEGSEGFSERCIELLNSPEICRVLGEQARFQALSLYSRSQMNARLSVLCREIYEKKAGFRE